jgi:hypothetical protein
MIDRFLVTHTIRGVLLVLSFFMVLFSFLDFLAQINDVGRGNYLRHSSVSGIKWPLS